ncbi:MAG: excinuclease ABC subunit UvrC [Clostridia bacterium]
MNEIIKHKLKELPTTSGVYLMQNSAGEIIYVGKAINLKNRVTQYFHSSGNKTEKCIQLVKNIVDFRYILTANEVDALVLENNLIKKYVPKYNILLKDDKNYPFIKINLKQKFPTVEVVRKLVDDGSKYFGPYMQGINTKDILDLIFSAFPLRSCNADLSKLSANHRPCLNSHIGLCKAPCDGKISEKEYDKIVCDVLEFLKGNDNDIKLILEEKMLNASKSEDYELALHYRDRIKTLEKLVRRQIAALPKNYNLDIFSVVDNGLYSAVSVLIVRGGKLLGGDNYPLTTLVNSEILTKSSIVQDKNKQVLNDDFSTQINRNMLSQFIYQYYQQTLCFPDEIVINDTLDEQNALEKLILLQFNKKLNIICPRQGVRRQLVEMAENNARDYLDTFVVKSLKKHSMTVGAVENLKTELKLDKLPRRIECFDISHISGTDKVASMVVFINGEPARKSYRRFKIKTVEGNNDFACMKECLLRRLLRLKNSEDESFSSMPDLIVIDGGKGQLKYALEAMSETNTVTQIISLAEREEEVFLPQVENSIKLPERSLSLSLLQRVRDEAHRFAIDYHRKLRMQHISFSELKNIKGIGDKKLNILYNNFKSLAKIKESTIESLSNVKGISNTDAVSIFNHFHDKNP